MSDGSTDDASGQVVARLLADWPGGYRYVRNRPALDLPGNMNRATSLAAGSGSSSSTTTTCCGPAPVGPCSTPSGGPARRSGCCCSGSMSSPGRRRPRTQTFRRDRYLPPGEAMQRVLRNSSFVRLPAVVHRAAFEEERVRGRPRGGLRHRHVDAAVLPLRGALRPQTTCAYTVHEAATTTGMWNQETVQAALGIFDRAVARGIVPGARSVAGDRFLPSVHPRRRLPAPPDAAARRGPRRASAVRPAGDPRPRRLAEMAAGAGRVRGGDRRDAPTSMTQSPGERT